MGVALYAVGAGLLLYTGGIGATGALARDRARTEWERAEARSVVHEVAARLDRRGEVAPPRPGAPVARIIIPRLGLDEVVVEGVATAQLNAGPGHVPGSVLPGESGNAVISAHRDRHFHALDRLAFGDTVVTETIADRVVWVVSGIRVVDRAAPALFASRTAELTLTTCWPVRYVGPAPDRLIIVARPVSRAPRA